MMGMPTGQVRDAWELLSATFADLVEDTNGKVMEDISAEKAEAVAKALETIKRAGSATRWREQWKIQHER